MPASPSTTTRRRRPTLTSRANLVAVITNGTAVLGLGNIGPLASKPVMEGKGCLFKKFAGIDVFDIEIDATDPDRIVDVVAALEPTFGGINLEDIKAPECFIVERRLRERMKIPVFHDDQHGTAIIVSAAVLNGLKLVGKDIASVKVAVSGAGAAALACLDLLVEPRRAARATSSSPTSRASSTRAAPRRWTPRRRATPSDTRARTLAEIMPGADVFLGLSAGGVLKPEMIKAMAARPADPGARQPGARDSARARPPGAARRHPVHRPLGLSQPGQQRAVLPLHLPRARWTSAPPPSTRP